MKTVFARFTVASDQTVAFLNEKLQAISTRTIAFDGLVEDRHRPDPGPDAKALLAEILNRPDAWTLLTPDQRHKANRIFAEPTFGEPREEP